MTMQTVGGGVIEFGRVQQDMLVGVGLDLVQSTEARYKGFDPCAN